TGSEYTELAVCEADTGKLLTRHALPLRDHAFAWQADGKAVALAGGEGGLTLVDVDSGATRFHAAGICEGPLAASADYRLLAALRTTRVGNVLKTAVVVWETATGKEVVVLPSNRVEHLALTPDRHLVATDDAFLRVIDLATGQE